MMVLSVCLFLVLLTCLVAVTVEEDNLPFTCNGVVETEQVCSGHGKCVSADVCECDGHPGESTSETDPYPPPLGPYAGKWCDVPVCFGILGTDTKKACSGHGSCTEPGTCVCVPSFWVGPQCEEETNCGGIDGSNGDVCGSHGSCIRVDDRDVCECEAGFEGGDCSTDVTAKKDAPPETPPEAVLPCGVSVDSKEPCSGHGNCSPPNSCVCSSGWTGEFCAEKEQPSPACSASDAKVCSGHGTCTAEDQCDCVSGWEGHQCAAAVSVPPTEDTICHGIAASNSTVCSEHGNCTAADHCDCDAGWEGDECADPSCYGTPTSDPTVCSEHGNCTAADQCACETGWEGDECADAVSCFNTLASDPKVCSEHGQCSATDQCACETGWEGVQCAVPTIVTPPAESICHGIAASSQKVCSEHGACTATDQCNCDSGWKGVQCAVPTIVTPPAESICHGIAASSQKVCSEHGACTATDQCNCDSGWEGVQCDVVPEMSCYGVVASDPLVCSSHGDCVKTDMCECKGGYGPPNCSAFECFDIDMDAPEVCSAHGDCTTPDVCECREDYSGKECDAQPYSCDGIASGSPGVCSTHGQCLPSGECNCSEGYNGDWCSVDCSSDVPSALCLSFKSLEDIKLALCGCDAAAQSDAVGGLVDCDKTWTRRTFSLSQHNLKDLDTINNVDQGLPGDRPILQPLACDLAYLSWIRHDATDLDSFPDEAKLLLDGQLKHLEAFYSERQLRETHVDLPVAKFVAELTDSSETKPVDCSENEGIPWCSNRTLHAYVLTIEEKILDVMSAATSGSVLAATKTVAGLSEKLVLLVSQMDLVNAMPPAEKVDPTPDPKLVPKIDPKPGEPERREPDPKPKEPKSEPTPDPDPKPDPKSKGVPKPTPVDPEPKPKAGEVEKAEPAPSSSSFWIMIAGLVLGLSVIGGCLYYCRRVYHRWTEIRRQRRIAESRGVHGIGVDMEA